MPRILVAVITILAGLPAAGALPMNEAAAGEPAASAAGTAGASAGASAAAPAVASAPAIRPVSTTAAGPGYLVVIGKGTDRERMMAYSRALPPVYAKAGGRYLAIGGPGRGVEWLAGPWRDRSLVLARFDGLPQVLSFWWGDDYREAVRLRERAGQFTVVAVPGAADDAARAVSASAVYLVETTVTRDADAYAAYRRALETLLAARGGHVLAPGEAGAYTALEGDPLYDRIAIAMLPSRAALDALLADPRAAELGALRERAGLSQLAVAAAAAAPATTAAPGGGAASVAPASTANPAAPR
jgi:uncharacterized protein (DUF1330 family)